MFLLYRSLKHDLNRTLKCFLLDPMPGIFPIELLTIKLHRRAYWSHKRAMGIKTDVVPEQITVRKVFC